MLTEEAHHMFVGESGISRIIQRTCEVMKENKVDAPADVRALGVIDLQTFSATSISITASRSISTAPTFLPTPPTITPAA